MRMSLRDWAESGWLSPHTTSREEIAGLLGVVDRDLADARCDISPDGRFGIAYNAALRLCTILLSTMATVLNALSSTTVRSRRLG
jgi:hypothetical protein